MQNQYHKRKVDYDVSNDMITLPAEYYQTDAIYREEINKIFYKRWLMVCREEEIPEPGDFMTVDVGDENIILVRCDKGEMRAHFNVCRHRGHWLLEGCVRRIADGSIPVSSGVRTMLGNTTSMELSMPRRS